MAFTPESINSYQAARKFLPRTSSLQSTATDKQFDIDMLEMLEGGDFWQGARRYSGPLPPPGDGFTEGMEALYRSYVPIMKLREVSQRHVRGVIGIPPHFEVVLDGLKANKKKRRKREDYLNTRDDLEALADEADDVQGDVWDEEGEHILAKKAVARLCATGKAYLRFDIPNASIVSGVDKKTGEETKGVAAETWQEVYRRTYLELVPRGSATVYTDPTSRRKMSFYSYKEPLDDDSTKTRNAIQMSWVGDDDLTRIKVVYSNGDTPVEWSADTGGVLLIVEMEAPPLLTPDLLKLQDAVCSIATNVKINSDSAGSPQVTLLDIDRPVQRIPTPTEEDPKAVTVKPVAIQNSPNSAQLVYSFVERDKNGDPMVKDGKPLVRQGHISFREPVDSQPLRDDIAFLVEEIYGQVNQRHLVKNVSANSSAELLAEMKTDYAGSLLETKPAVERALRSVLKGRLCYAAHLATGEEAERALNEFKRGRVRVDLKLNTGPLSTEEKQAIKDRWEAGLLTKELAMILIGDADDVEAEMLAQEEEAAKPENLNRTPVPRSKVAPLKPELVKDAA